MATAKKNKFDKFKQKEPKDYYQILTDNMIKKMEESVEYNTPWLTCNELPYNPITKTKYSGVNLLYLLMEGYNDPRFYTFNNVKELAKESGLNIYVKSGEHGTPVFKALQRNIENIDEQSGEDKSFSIWSLAYAGTVFNAKQIEGLPPLVELPKIDFQGNEHLDLIESSLIKTGLKVESHEIGRASYIPSKDTVMLPNKELFKSENLYMRTKLHEFVHATGSEKRLKRDLSGKFGTMDYAFEELVAELGSYFLGGHIGIDYSSDNTTHENHAAYLKSWLSSLKDDKKFIWKASSQAAKAMDYIVGLTEELKVERKTNLNFK